MNKQLLVIGAFALSIAACGGTKDPITQPPPANQDLASIAPASANVTLNAGQRSTIAMTATSTTGSTLSATGYSYTSASPSVASVSTAGVITGLSAGATTITVSLTLNNITKTAQVNVTVSGQLPTTVTVVAGANTQDFTPNFVALARNGTVTYTFGPLIHNVTFGAGGGAPADIPNSSNTSVSRTFPTAGTFAYTCTLHSNMNGTVLVP